GLVVYKLGTDTTVTQYFEFDNKKFQTTIIFYSGSVTKYEADGELDETGDLKQVFSKILTLDSSGKWTLTSEGTNVFTGDSSVYTARRNGKEIGRGEIFDMDLAHRKRDATHNLVLSQIVVIGRAILRENLFNW